MPGWLEQALGAAIILIVLLDVFMTLLYARLGGNIISHTVARVVWRGFQLLALPFGPRRGAILSFCGPAMIVMLIAFWAFGLTFGVALVLHPALGTGIRAATGETTTDFITALLAGGNSLSILGAGNFVPVTPALKIFDLFTSLLGLSVTTLILSFLVLVYSALLRRNALSLQLHLQSDQTDDAAVLLAALGPEGDFSGGYTNLSEAATQMAEITEAHHHYPILFYYRFREPFYSVAETTLLALDVVTLIRSALDDEKHGWLKQSAAVSQLGSGSLMLVTALEDAFVPGGIPSRQPIDDATVERWRIRYIAAVRHLQQAKIETIADEQAGAALYCKLRSKWDRHISTLAPWMGYAMDEIDPAGTYPDRRPAARR